MRFILLSFAVVILTKTPLMAQESVIQLPDGQTALNISATERVEVDQDTLQASLRIQKKMESAVELQNWINTAMKKALELAKKYPEIKIETGQYYVHPDYRRVKNRQTGETTQEISQWRGSQTLSFKATEPENVLKLAGEVQDMGFIMNSLGYHLSKDKYEETRDSLMEAAITKLRERAERVAKALGKESVDIVEINVDSQPNMPRPVYARAQMMEMSTMAAESMQSPSAEAGSSDVSMSISARAIIK